MNECPLKRHHFKRNFLFQPWIFRGELLVFRGGFLRQALYRPSKTSFVEHPGFVEEAQAPIAYNFIYIYIILKMPKSQTVASIFIPISSSSLFEKNQQKTMAPTKPPFDVPATVLRQTKLHEANGNGGPESQRHNFLLPGPKRCVRNVCVWHLLGGNPSPWFFVTPWEINGWNLRI